MCTLVRIQPCPPTPFSLAQKLRMGERWAFSLVLNWLVLAFPDPAKDFFARCRNPECHPRRREMNRHRLDLPVFLETARRFTPAKVNPGKWPRMTAVLGDDTVPTYSLRIRRGSVSWLSGQPRLAHHQKGGGSATRHFDQNPGSPGCPGSDREGLRRPIRPDPGKGDRCDR